VRLTVDGTASPSLPVAADGTVTLPAPLRGRTFRLEILTARWPAGTPGRIQQRRAVGIGEIHGAGVATVSPRRTGALTLPCGVATVDAGGTTLALRATTDRASLDAGRPIRLEGCSPLDLPARDTTLIGSSGFIKGSDPLMQSPRKKGSDPFLQLVREKGSDPVTGLLRVDGLRLASAAPAPVAAPTGGGRVVDAGSADHGGRSGVEVDVQGPSYLVLGQSFDKGWRATCDGDDLGAPQVLQGYANAWPVDRGCRDVAFRYAPQKVADAGYLISAVGCAALLALLGVGAYRRRRAAAAVVPPDDPAPLPEPPAAAPLPVTTAIAVALPAAVVVGGLFGLRAGAVAAPLLVLILWRGLSDRAIGLWVLGLLGVVVPAIYVGVSLFSGEEILGGNSTRFGADRLGAHWVAVAAYVLLVVLLVRTLAAARVRDRLPSRR
jgi:hypothetical protein